MKVFISWSGERSGRIASVLAAWLPKVIQAVSPWLSSASIDPGARWNEEVTRALGELQYGVLCLTPENITAPWVLFEAGALSKAVSASRVIPYLLGFEPRELQGPLAQFQSVRADEQGTLRLVNAINDAEGNPILSPEALSEAFQVWWPRLAPEIESLSLSSPVNTPAPQRSVESMVGEVLELMRAQQLAVTEPDPQRSWVDKTFPDQSRVGLVIRQWRLRRHLTQRELSERARVSPDYLSRIETGARVPSIEVLTALGAALGVSLSTILNASFSEAVSPDDSDPEPAT